MKKKIKDLEKDLEQIAEARMKNYEKEEKEMEKSNPDNMQKIAQDILKLIDINLIDKYSFINKLFADFMGRIMNCGGAESLINDDNGHWAIASEGYQSVTCSSKPRNLETMFMVKASYFSDTIEGALVKWAQRTLKGK